MRSGEAWSDDEICAGMRDPERRAQAFRALHARFGPRLLGLLVRMTHGDRDLAEDLLGRALYKAYQGLARLERPCRSLSSWLYTVAARTALDELARRSAESEALPLNEELTAAGIRELSETPQDVADAVERVLEELDREDPRYRTLLEMEHVGACDRAEIAEATGIARKQLSQYLIRAKQRFTTLARKEPALKNYGDPPV